jgi:hypothetical protein
MAEGAGLSLHVIGQPLRRKEDQRLLTGKGRFSDDNHLPGQAYATMLRSPYPHARILGVATEAARAMPGVLGVYSGADCKADGLGPIPHQPVPSTRYDMKLTAPGGGKVFIGPHELLPTDKARHVGEAVAMVVAETLAQALDAAEAVEIRLRGTALGRRGRGCVEARRARDLGCGVGQRPGRHQIRRCGGDRARLRRGRSCRFKMDFHVGRVTAVTMEPRACLAAYDPASQPLRALCRHRGCCPPEARAGRRAGRAAGNRPGHLAGRRRQFRLEEPALCRIRPGDVGGAQARPAGQIHRDAQRSLLERLSGPRPGDQARARLAQGRPVSRLARRQYQQRRRAQRLALAAWARARR